MQSLALAACAGTGQTLAAQAMCKAATAPNAKKLRSRRPRHQVRIDRIHTPAGAATFSPLALAAAVPSYKWMTPILSVMMAYGSQGSVIMLDRRIFLSV